jgi:hypothetical protein
MYFFSKNTYNGPVINEEYIMKIMCLSVPGGWQSCYEGTDVTFGPTFHKIQDLWAWQKTLVG